MADTPVTESELIKAHYNLVALDGIMNGSINTTVTTPDGQVVKSVAKALNDVALATSTVANYKGQWNELTSYDTAQTVTASNGVLYASKVGSNIDNDPIEDDGTNWNPVGTVFVQNIEQLRLFVPSIDGFPVQLLGYHNIGDGGGGFFYWDASSIEVDNLGTIIAVDSITTGRWKRLYSGAVNVRWFGAKGHDTFDSYPAIQAACNLHVPVFIPYDEKSYKISKTIEIGVGATTSAVIYSDELGKPFGAKIETLPNFDGYAVFRNWSNNWYELGANKEEPPADMTDYENMFSRYVNINCLRIIINGTQSNRINAIDLIAQHEGSLIERCLFMGNATIKGYPIKVTSTSTGNEISNNVFNIKNCICYDTDWRGQVKITGRGNGINIEGMVTTKEECSESPFQITTISLTMLNVHCEAFAEGLPTYDLSCQGISILQGFTSIRDLQGDVFKFYRPSGSAFFTAPSIIGHTIHPVGSSWGNITNSATIKLINDLTTPTAYDTRIQMLVPLNMGAICYINEYNYNSLTVSDGSGKTISKNYAGMFVPLDKNWNNSSNLSIPYKLNSLNNGCILTVTGRRNSDGKPFLLRVWLGVADNSAGFISRDFYVLENVNALGTISANFATDRYELVTDSTTGMSRINLNITSPTRFASMEI